MTDTGSRTVDWWSVYTFIKPYLDVAGEYPMVGTLAWQQLPGDHPQKWAALLDAAAHHSLRVENSQSARAQAAQAVASAVSWPAIAREYLQRVTARASGAHIERRSA